jgi:hypothetical protein
MTRKIATAFAVFSEEFLWSRPGTTQGFGAWPSGEAQEHPEDFVDAAVAAGKAVLAEPKKKLTKAEAERQAKEQAEAEEKARLEAEAAAKAAAEGQG